MYNISHRNIYHHRLEDHLDVVKFQPYKRTATVGEWQDEYLKMSVFPLIPLKPCSNLTAARLNVSLFLADEEEEEYINFVVIDEFHEKFGPAVSLFNVHFPV